MSDMDPWVESGLDQDEIEALLHHEPDREDLPEGAIKCPSCERHNDRDDLVWHVGHGWCCPDAGCTYADPYWNQ